MTNILDEIAKEQEAKMLEGKEIPEFNAGDTIKVNIKVSEGGRERIQAYEGVCLARQGGGIHASFTVRKISHGEGVERVFPLYSNKISSIEVVRRGQVRRSKLYYLRERSGKSARIKERKAKTQKQSGQKNKKPDSKAVAAE